MVIRFGLVALGNNTSVDDRTASSRLAKFTSPGLVACRCRSQLDWYRYYHRFSSVTQKLVGAGIIV